ncbi:cysteine hydrolase [Caldimonas tepidiphila]|uniref:cysteine hydrolase n=1 Tax=Caldimonas tepidiphila TaxID=2315841 RepID=UPI000E5BB7EC|nr:cysteine hydrolase [Caldimonas tepidiphila]
MSDAWQLLIIDPQNDFCDLPGDWCPGDPLGGPRLAPALPVPGAHADMLRLAALLLDAGDGFDDISITLDSHQRLDIAHVTFWQRGDGGPVQPFTEITAQQVRGGDYLPRVASALPRTLAYLDELEARGRYRLMAWPVHCEIGAWGHNVHAAVRAACNVWEDETGRPVHKVAKGTSPWTEHYSALQAEVPDDEDPGTQLNRPLLSRLDDAELLVVAGEASSHCVRASTEHLVEHLPGGRPERLLLLTDCMSPVAGFQRQHEEFLAAMRARGVQLATCDELRPRLLERAGRG